jgi:hypothetical protein
VGAQAGRPVTPLEELLRSTNSVIEVATALGRACLDEQRLLEDTSSDVRVKESTDYLCARAAATDASAWEPREAGKVPAQLRDQETQTVMRRLAPLDPLGHLAVLRGLCERPLRLFYESFEGQLTLRRGTPIPHATRPVQHLFGARTTPYQMTTTARELLGRTGFDLYREGDSGVTVVIDYSHRERLDAITWPERLPRVGTIHPRLDGERLQYALSGNAVFDVRPAEWSLAETLEHLRAVGDAEVAVLPELCLPSPDALEAALKSEASRCPPLVVAGSAHARVSERGAVLCVNESRAYIDGERVLTHRKIRPLETRQIANQRFDALVREDLSAGPRRITLLSGERTRLSVVICADLNDSAVPRVLEECGVNLLLVPSLTYKTGAFNGAVCQLASKCQALCVVANPILDQLAPEPQPPFLVLASVPRSGANEQSREYSPPPTHSPPPTQTAVLGMLDPNQPLASPAAHRWRL